MELHQLRYALRLAAHLHFSKAANELGITQPSLSQQIDKLEKELGVKLFMRRTRSVELTTAGEEFVARANRVIAELDQLRATMKNHTHPTNETIRIGTFLSNMGELKLGALFQQFQKIYLNINIQVVEKPGSYDLSKLLKSGSIDGAFLVPSVALRTDQTITCHTIVPGIVHVILRKDHPFAGQKSVLLSDLPTQTCVVMSHTYSIYGSVMDACKASGFHLKIGSHCNYVETMVDLVAQGFGISFLSSQFAETISHPDITSRPLEPFIDRNLSFVYLTEKTSSAPLISFRDYILNTFNL